MIYTENHIKSIEKLGGKAYNLDRLRRMNFNVPSFFVLDTDFFWSFLGEDEKEYRSLLKAYSTENLPKIRQLIHDKDFSKENKDFVLERLSENFSKSDKLAVRSSATDEDGYAFSFAGMMESYLEVPVNEKVFEYIKKCYLSCFSDRAMEYRLRQGLANENLSMAVIIQKLIEPDFSAVMFTTNPQTNNPDEILISLVKGFGENLVSGKENSEDFITDNFGEISPLSKKASFDEALIRKIVAIGRKIESSYEEKRGRDIELAVKDGEIYVLQERLITNYSHIDKNKFRTIYDNSNIIESYSGVTTPLTFSFAREVYEKIYRQTLNNFYITKEDIESIKDDLKQMICFYENRVYYRLNSWYRMTALYPGYNKNKKYMENMMGVKLELKETKAKEKLRLFKIYLRFIYKLLRIKKDSKAFTEKFENLTRPYFNNSFESYSNSELLKLYKTLEDNILDDFTTPITNDMGAMVFFGALSEKLKKKKIPEYEGLLGKVLGKQGNVESVKQSLALEDIVKSVKADEKSREYFLNTDIESLVKDIKNTDEISKMIREYIDKYGARTMEELKLETLTLFEDPSPLFETIKSYLCVEDLKSVYRGEDFDVKDFYKYFGFFEKLYIKPMLSVTKYFVRNREMLRLRRTYIYSIVRNIFIRMGKNFERDGLIKEARDIFFITKDEAFEMAAGNTEEFRDITDKIEERKKEYLENKEKPAYERMYFYGEVRKENMLPIFCRQEAEILKENVLKGVAGGGAVTEGIVKFVKDPSNTDVSGYILMAERTDPGWTVLFPMTKAVIIERGSVLSHSAVIAREMGLTLVVGIRGLTKYVKDGMKVRVDGVKGTVEILEEENEKR